MKQKLLSLLVIWATALTSCGEETMRTAQNLAVSFIVDSPEPFENELLTFTNIVEGVNIASDSEDETDDLEVQASSASTSYDEFRFIWTFGDGSSVSNEKNPTHFFDKVGKYTVKLLVIGKDGSSGTFSQEFSVRKYDGSLDRKKVEEQWANPSMVREIAPGVTYKRLVFNKETGNPIFNSNQYVGIIETDLSANPDLKFVVSYPGNSSSSKKTTVAANERNALAAINGTMWNWTSADEANRLQKATFNGTVPLPLWSETILPGNNSRDYIRVYNTDGTTLLHEAPNFGGNVFQSGKKVVRSDRRTGVIKIGLDGKVEIENTRGQDINYEYNMSHETYKWILASGPMLVDNGEVCYMDANELNDDRHPRTSLAVMPDGKVLMVVVDGRRAAKGAAGMTLRTELSKFLDWIGCSYAINLDGGGSSTLYARDNVSDLANPLDNGILNHPTDNKDYDNQGNLTFDNKGERSVGGGCILLLDGQSTPLF